MHTAEWDDTVPLAGLRVGNSHAWDFEELLGIPFGVLSTKRQRRLGDEAKASPLEMRTQLEDFAQHLERRRVAAIANDSFVLVLDLGAAFGKLAQQHCNALQNVDRFEPGRHEGQTIFARNELIRASADHGAHVAGAEEPVELHARRRRVRVLNAGVPLDVLFCARFLGMSCASVEREPAVWCWRPAGAWYLLRWRSAGRPSARTKQSGKFLYSPVFRQPEVNDSAKSGAIQLSCAHPQASGLRRGEGPVRWELRATAPRSTCPFAGERELHPICMIPGCCNSPQLAPRRGQEGAARPII